MSDVACGICGKIIVEFDDGDKEFVTTYIVCCMECVALMDPNFDLTLGGEE